MKRFFTEISYDVNFLKGHTLQPAWVKVVKIFILPAVLAGFILLFGWRRAAVFTVVFVLLMLVVHMIYRANTRKFTRNWMDFILVEDAERNLKQGIGAVYYASIVLDAVIAFFSAGCWRADQPRRTLSPQAGHAPFLDSRCDRPRSAFIPDRESGASRDATRGYARES